MEIDGWTIVEVLGPRNLMVNLTGLSAGQKYRIRVRACNSAGLSDWNDPVMFTATGTPAALPGMYSNCLKQHCIVFCIHSCAIIRRNFCGCSLHY